MTCLACGAHDVERGRSLPATAGGSPVDFERCRSCGVTVAVPVAAPLFLRPSSSGVYVSYTVGGLTA